MQAGKLNIICGGQAGSEAKGKLSAWICDHYPVDLLVMTSSPNAGHTAYDYGGTKHVSYHLPIGSIFTNCSIVLGPASLINPDTLAKEINALGIQPNRVIIDQRASIITQGCIAREKSCGLSDIGSTLQGIGETRTTKMRRDGSAVLVGDERVKDVLGGIGVQIATSTSDIVNFNLHLGSYVLCEMTQGFDLDLEHGIHPRYCTSKMINPSMAMAEAGVSPHKVGDIYGVIRPYPIRVNNRTGTSGPYAEAEEITWEQVGAKCGAPLTFEGEITTTTKLPRRVFEFSWDRYGKFVEVCGPTAVCLQFANYINWECYGARAWEGLTEDVHQFIEELERFGEVPVEFVGTGFEHEAMVHLPRNMKRYP